MPELPDVETFKRYLDATSLHQPIKGIDVRSAYVLKGVSERELGRQLKGRSLERSCRHGKHLFVRTDRDLWLRLHFGMTGSLEYLKREQETPKDTRVVFGFANHSRLAFRDQRKFGEIGLLKDVDEFLRKRALGPDALNINLSQFKGIFEKHRVAVKTILLKPKMITCTGNISADETHLRARIRQAKQARALKAKAITKLLRATRHILKKAIDSQADADRMPRSWLLAHRGKGGKCPRCGGSLKSSRIGGRTA